VPEIRPAATTGPVINAHNGQHSPAPQSKLVTRFLASWHRARRRWLSNLSGKSWPQGQYPGDSTPIPRRRAPILRGEARGALPPWLLPPRDAALTQRHLRLMNAIPGATLSRVVACALGSSHRPACRHQLGDQLSTSLLAEPGITRTPPTTVDDDVPPVRSSLHIAHEPC
jgi:hypothetical protein